MRQAKRLGSDGKRRAVPRAERDADAENKQATGVVRAQLPDCTAQAQRPGNQPDFPLRAPRPGHHACYRLEQHGEVHGEPDAPDKKATGNQVAIGDVGS